MSFRSRCKGICYRIPIGVMLTVCIVSMLISMLCGCFVVTNRTEICFPRFSLPVFLLSLLIIITHILLFLYISFRLLDNYRCKSSIRTLVLLLLIFLLSVAGFNFLVRLGAAVLSVFIFAFALALMIFHIAECKKSDLLFTLPIAAVLLYFLIISIFVNA